MAQPLSGSFGEPPVVYSGPYANLSPMPQDFWNLCFKEFSFRELATTITLVNRSFRKIAIQAIHERIRNSLKPFEKFFKRPAMATGAPTYQFAYAEQIYCQMKVVKGDLLQTVRLSSSNYYTEIGNRLGQLNHLGEIQRRTRCLIYYGDYHTALLSCKPLLKTTHIGARIFETIFREKQFRCKNEWTLFQQFKALAHFAQSLPQGSPPYFDYSFGELFNLGHFTVADEVLREFPDVDHFNLVQTLVGQHNYWRGAYIYSHRLPISDLRDMCLLQCLKHIPFRSGSYLVEFFEVIQELHKESAKRQARIIFAQQISPKHGEMSWEQFKILVSTAYPEQISLIEKETKSLIRRVCFVNDGLKRRRSDL